MRHPEVIEPAAAGVPVQRRPEDQVADVVDAGRRLEEATRAAIERAVIRMRLAGRSWADVARAAGVSKTTAYRLWAQLDRDTMVEVRVMVDERGRRRGAFWSAALNERLPNDDAGTQLLGARAGYQLRELVQAWTAEVAR
jgi:transposase